jgi:hypothetical protein
VNAYRLGQLAGLQKLAAGFMGERIPATNWAALSQPQPGQREALNNMLRNLANRSPKEFQQLRKMFGGSKRALKSVYPSIARLIRGVR